MASEGNRAEQKYIRGWWECIGVSVLSKVSGRIWDWVYKNKDVYIYTISLV